MSLTSILYKFRETLLQQKFIALFFGIWLLLIFLIRINSYQEKEFSPDYSDNNFQIFGLNIPRNLEFAGERVPKNDYSIKESLEKELFTDSYWKRNAAVLYARARRWFPYIEPILKAEGVPDDFKYVAVIESHLTNVVSPRGAGGFWQLIEPTAVHFGLKVGDGVDERYDVEKATHAACKMIKAAHKEFDNWTLAAAAYNLGIGGIQGKMNRQKADSYYELMLNKETGSYVYRILAYKTLFHNPEHFGIKEKKLKKMGVIPYKTLTVDSAVTNIPALCEREGIKESAFYSLNAWIRYKTIPNPEKVKLNLRLPKNKALDYSDYYADLYPGFSTVTVVNDSTQTLPADSTAMPLSIKHEVKEGESMKQIAELYSITVAELLLWNNLKEEVELKPSTELIIYTKPNSNSKEEISDGHEKK